MRTSRSGCQITWEASHDVTPSDQVPGMRRVCRGALMEEVLAARGRRNADPEPHPHPARRREGEDDLDVLTSPFRALAERCGFKVIREEDSSDVGSDVSQAGSSECQHSGQDKAGSLDRNGSCTSKGEVTVRTRPGTPAVDVRSESPDAMLEEVTSLCDEDGGEIDGGRGAVGKSRAISCGDIGGGERAWGKAESMTSGHRQNSDKVVRQAGCVSDRKQDGCTPRSQFTKGNRGNCPARKYEGGASEESRTSTARKDGGVRNSKGPGADVADFANSRRDGDVVCGRRHSDVVRKYKDVSDRAATVGCDPADLSDDKSSGTYWTAHEASPLQKPAKGRRQSTGLSSARRSNKSQDDVTATHARDRNYNGYCREMKQQPKQQEQQQEQQQQQQQQQLQQQKQYHQQPQTLQQKQQQQQLQVQHQQQHNHHQQKQQHQHQHHHQQQQRQQKPHDQRPQQQQPEQIAGVSANRRPQKFFQESKQARPQTQRSARDAESGQDLEPRFDNGGVHVSRDDAAYRSLLNNGPGVTGLCYESHRKQRATGSEVEQGQVRSQGEQGQVRSQGEQGQVRSQGEQGQVRSQGEQGHVRSQGEQGQVRSQGEQGHVTSAQRGSAYRVSRKSSGKTTCGVRRFFKPGDVKVKAMPEADCSHDVSEAHLGGGDGGVIVHRGDVDTHSIQRYPHEPQETTRTRISNEHYKTGARSGTEEERNKHTYEIDQVRNADEDEPVFEKNPGIRKRYKTNKLNTDNMTRAELTEPETQDRVYQESTSRPNGPGSEEESQVLAEISKLRSAGIYGTGRGYAESSGDNFEALKTDTGTTPEEHIFDQEQNNSRLHKLYPTARNCSGFSTEASGDQNPRSLTMSDGASTIHLRGVDDAHHVTMDRWDGSGQSTDFQGDRENPETQRTQPLPGNLKINPVYILGQTQHCQDRQSGIQVERGDIWHKQQQQQQQQYYQQQQQHHHQQQQQEKGFCDPQQSYHYTPEHGSKEEFPTSGVSGLPVYTAAPGVPGVASITAGPDTPRVPEQQKPGLVSSHSQHNHQHNNHKDFSFNLNSNYECSEEGEGGVPGSRFIGQYFLELWKNQCLCDVRLRVGNWSYLAHKIVLAAFSDFFCPSDPHCMPSICFDIPNATPDAVHQILLYLYTSEMEITDYTLESVLSAAESLGVSEVINLVKEILENPTADNFEHYLEIRSRHGFPGTLTEYIELLREHLLDMTTSPYFLELDLNELQAILGDPEVKVDSECDVIDIIARWIEYSPLERIAYSADLLTYVNFDCIPADSLADVVERKRHVFSRDAFSLFLEAFKNRSLSVECPPCPPQQNCWPQSGNNSTFRRPLHATNKSTNADSYRPPPPPQPPQLPQPAQPVPHTLPQTVPHQPYDLYDTSNAPTLGRTATTATTTTTSSNNARRLPRASQSKISALIGRHLPTRPGTAQSTQSWASDAAPPSRASTNVSSRASSAQRRFPTTQNRQATPRELMSLACRGDGEGRPSKQHRRPREPAAPEPGTPSYRSRCAGRPAFYRGSNGNAIFSPPGEQDCGTPVGVNPIWDDGQSSPGFRHPAGGVSPGRSRGSRGSSPCTEAPPPPCSTFRVVRGGRGPRWEHRSRSPGHGSRERSASKKVTFM